MTLLYNGFLVLLIGVLLPLAGGPVISSPQNGAALQGQVTISGSTNVVGFKSYEVLFTYDSLAKPTWFLISQSDKLVDNGPLAVWDTTTITDGNYRLMVRVLTEDGNSVETVVSGLRVRNYMPVETETPALVATEAVGTPAAVGTVMATIPANPAGVTVTGLLINVAKGVGIGFLVLLVVGVVLYYASKPRRSRRRRA